MALDFIHHNLNTGRVSVKVGKSPVRACDAALVANARPQVSAARFKYSLTASTSGGPKRVVFADIRGNTIRFANDSAPDIKRGRRITLSPFRKLVNGTPVFHYADNGEIWTGSVLVIVADGYAFEVTR